MDGDDESMPRPLVAYEGFSDGDEKTYRPLSRWAVVSAITGAFAPLAMFGPSLWFIPFVGGFTAAVALAAMARPGVAMIGRGAAMAGLVLSMAFGSAGVASWLVSWGVAQRHAVAVAEAWVGLVRDGRLLEARGMFTPETAPVGLLAIAGSGDDEQRPIDDIDANERAMSQLPSVAAVVACGDESATAAGVFAAFVPDSDEHREEWQVRVMLGPCRGLDPLRLLFHLRRSMREDSTAWSGWVENWSIAGVDVGG